MQFQILQKINNTVYLILDEYNINYIICIMKIDIFGDFNVKVLFSWVYLSIQWVKSCFLVIIL